MNNRWSNMKQVFVLIVIIFSIVFIGCVGKPPIISTPTPTQMVSPAELTPSPTETPILTPTERGKFFAFYLDSAYSNGEINISIFSSDPVLVSSMRWIIEYYPRENKTYEITEYSQILVNGNISNSNTVIPPLSAKVVIITWDIWKEGQEVSLLLVDKATGNTVESRPVNVRERTG